MAEDFEKYKTDLDELNIITDEIYRTADDASDANDQILTILINAYREGMACVGRMLNTELTPDVYEMYNAIYENIEGKTFENRARDHYEEDELEDLHMLVESEYHRCFNHGEMDGAMRYQEDNPYSQVYKTWVTAGDERVRDTHVYLEGVSIPVTDEFYTYDGDHAYQPGGFEYAGNNVNCRCILVFGINS